MSTSNHGHIAWDFVAPQRCMVCGHRFGPGTRQTREQPPWTWPGELINRHRARRQGRRLGLA